MNLKKKSPDNTTPDLSAFRKKEPNKIAFVSFFFIFVGVVIVIYSFSNFSQIATSSQISYGIFGDFVGGIVGSLWGLAGVLLFYAALYEQRKEFKLQSREFELQRQELQETRKIFELQSNTLKTQQFEETFFNLLTLYQNVANEIKDLQKIKIKNYSAKLPEKANSFVEILKKKSKNNFKELIAALQKIHLENDNDSYKKDLEIKYFGDDKVENSGFRTLYLAFLNYSGIYKIDNLLDVSLLCQSRKQLNENSWKTLQETFLMRDHSPLGEEGEEIENQEMMVEILENSFSAKEQKDKIGYYALILEKEKGKEESFKDIKKNYEIFSHTYNASLQPFILNLFQILRFIDNSEITDKKTYVNLVRAQLSSYELLLLFYHCISSENKIKIKEYIEKYHLFKHLQKNKLISETHSLFYNSSAFL